MIGRVEFRAAGMPRPQGSKRGFVNSRNGQVIITESNPKGHRDWRATVAAAAQDAMEGRALLDGPLRVTMTFALPRPKSHPKTRRTWPTTRPDVDKLARAVADSCTHTIWRDDSQIVVLYVSKLWAEVDTPEGPGVAVRVDPMVPQQPAPYPTTVSATSPPGDPHD